MFETECNQLTWASNLRINVKLECSLLVCGSHFLSHLFHKYVKIYLNSYKPYFIGWPCVKVHIFLSRAVSTIVHEVIYDITPQRCMSYFVKMICISVLGKKSHWKTLSCPLALMNRKNNTPCTLALAGSRKYVSFFILI